jgi:hypothetical protein
MASPSLCTDLQQIARYVFNGSLSLVQHFYTFVLIPCAQISLFLSPPNKAPVLQRKPDSAGIPRNSCCYQANVTFFDLFFLIDFLYNIFFLRSFSQFVYIFTLITNSFSHSQLTATSICKFIHAFIVLSSCNPSCHLL